MTRSEPRRRLKESGLTYMVVRALTDMILDEGMGPGDRLPPLGELCAQLGVSQASVREAMRILEARGLVEAVHGKGVIVSRRPCQALGVSMQNVFRLRGGGLSDVQALRYVLAVSAAELAALSRTDQDLTALAGLVGDTAAPAELDSGGVRIERGFRDTVAEATHNPALISVLVALEQLVESVEVDATVTAPAEGAVECGERQAVFDAIRARDANRARAAMRTLLHREAGGSRATADPSAYGAAA